MEVSIMGDNDFRMEEIMERFENMKAEIASLKDTLVEREASVAKNMPDMGKIKSLFEDAFAKLIETIRPVLDGANRSISEPAKAVASKVEEKIIIHPFTAVMIALGAGIVIGKTINIVSRVSGTKTSDEG